MGAFCGRTVRWVAVVLASVTSIGAVSPWLSASREGISRRDTVKSFVEDFSKTERYPVIRTCRLVHSLTEHSIHRRIRIWENWIQWTLGQVYPPLLRSQNADRILECGYGDCSERVAVLQSILRQSRLTTKIVGLGGHVVLELHANGKWYTLDPDYGIVFSKSLPELQQATDDKIAHPLIRAGYDDVAIAEYVRILKSTQDNIAMPINSPLSPRLHWIEQLCGFLLVAIPCTLWVIAATLWIGNMDVSIVPFQLERK